MKYLFLIALTTGLCLCENCGGLAESQKAVAVAPADVIHAVLPKKSLLESQQQCSERAKVVFISQHWKKEENARFTSHYAAASRKCFLDVATSSQYLPNVPLVGEIVYDVANAKEMAVFLWINTRGKVNPEAAPITCTVTDDTGQESQCKSLGEFKQSIRQFLK